MLSIGELAQRTGASVRSLRHYEQEGLLVSSRQPNGYRSFEPAAVHFVDRIRTLLRNGFTLEEVRPIVSMLDPRTANAGICPDVIAQYGRKLEELDQRIAALAEIRARAAERLEVLNEQQRDPSRLAFVIPANGGNHGELAEPSIPSLPHRQQGSPRSRG